MHTPTCMHYGTDPMSQPITVSSCVPTPALAQPTLAQPSTKTTPRAVLQGPLWTQTLATLPSPSFCTSATRASIGPAPGQAPSHLLTPLTFPPQYLLHPSNHTGCGWCRCLCMHTLTVQGLPPLRSPHWLCYCIPAPVLGSVMALVCNCLFA